MQKSHFDLCRRLRPDGALVGSTGSASVDDGGGDDSDDDVVVVSVITAADQVAAMDCYIPAGPDEPEAHGSSDAAQADDSNAPAHLAVGLPPTRFKADSERVDRVESLAAAAYTAAREMDLMTELGGDRAKRFAFADPGKQRRLDFVRRCMEYSCQEIPTLLRGGLGDLEKFCTPTKNHKPFIQLMNTKLTAGKATQRDPSTGKTTETVIKLFQSSSDGAHWVFQPSRNGNEHSLGEGVMERLNNQQLEVTARRKFPDSGVWGDNPQCAGMEQAPIQPGDVTLLPPQDDGTLEVQVARLTAYVQRLHGLVAAVADIERWKHDLERRLAWPVATTEREASNASNYYPELDDRFLEYVQWPAAETDFDDAMQGRLDTAKRASKRQRQENATAGGADIAYHWPDEPAEF
eukprot:COSAG01_NODE_5697_length_4090_cov_62.563518_4_plen_406_part_00